MKNIKLNSVALIFASSIGVSTMLSGCGEDASELYSMAQSRIQENNGVIDSQVVDLYTQSEELGLAQAGIELAKYYFAKNEYQKAYELISKYKNTDEITYAYIVGSMSLNGTFLKKDEALGEELLKKASLANVLAAIYDLAYYYDRNLRYDDAIKYYRLAVDMNNDNARLPLIHIYFDGKGSTVDKEYAFKVLQDYVQKNQSNIDAVLLYAECYIDGFGVEQNLEKAKNILKPVANAKNNRANYLLAKIDVYSKDPKAISNGITQLSRLAKEKSFPEAAYLLYEIYIDGLYGQKKDRKEAIYYIRIANQANYPKSYVALANMYYEGLGVEANPLEALRLVNKSYEFYPADPATNYLLGKMYETGTGVKKNDLKAYEFYSVAAKEKYKDSRFIVAKMMSEGRAPQTTASEAINLFKTLAEEGDVMAAYYYGDFLYQGIGTPRDVELANHYLKKAVDGGVDEALYLLAVTYDDLEDLSNAIVWYKVVSDKNIEKSAESAARLGEIYYGLDKINDSIKFYQKAADLGHIGAMANLGRIHYMKGEYDKARKCFEKIDKNSTAQTFIGLMYEKGNGYRKSEIKALEWYDKAIAQDNSDAMFLKGILLEKGKDVPEHDKKMAEEMLMKASCKLNEAAIGYLGNVFYKSRGDASRGFAWLKYGQTVGNIQSFSYTLSKSADSQSMIDKYLNEIKSLCRKN